MFLMYGVTSFGHRRMIDWNACVLFTNTTVLRYRVSSELARLQAVLPELDRLLGRIRVLPATREHSCELAIVAIDSASTHFSVPQKRSRIGTILFRYLPTRTPAA